MNKSQSATEYLMIVGFVIVILLPGIYLYMKYSGESQDSVTSAKVDAIANEIIKAVDQVYGYGEGSQTTVSVDFPKNVQEVTFEYNEDTERSEIVFTVINSKGGQSEISKVANVRLDNQQVISVIPGIKKIIVKSLGNAVSVYVQCNNDDEREGSVWECQYYLESNECTMRCYNNKWEAVQE
jgi:copper chaperone CopZ